MKFNPPPMTFREMMDEAKASIYEHKEAARPLMEGYNPNPRIPPRRTWKLGKLLLKRFGGNEALLKQFLNETRGPGEGQKFLDRWNELDAEFGEEKDAV